MNWRIFVINIEHQKSWRKVLTKGERSGILHKSPKARGNLKRRFREKEVEKTSRNFLKPLDKRKTLWYNTKVAAKRQPRKRANGKQELEKSWKNFQKVLDKRKKMWYNKQAFRKANKTSRKSVCTLKIEQRKTRKRKNKYSYNSFSRKVKKKEFRWWLRSLNGKRTAK